MAKPFMPPLTPKLIESMLGGRIAELSREDSLSNGCPGCNRRPCTCATSSVADALSKQRDDQAWMHAACLTIAETGQKWGENVQPSAAMQAVYNLYHSRLRMARENVRDRLENENLRRECATLEHLTHSLTRQLEELRSEHTAMCDSRNKVLSVADDFNGITRELLGSDHFTAEHCAECGQPVHSLDAWMFARADGSHSVIHSTCNPAMLERDRRERDVIARAKDGSIVAIKKTGTVVASGMPSPFSVNELREAMNATDGPITRLNVEQADQQLVTNTTCLHCHKPVADAFTESNRWPLYGIDGHGNKGLLHNACRDAWAQSLATIGCIEEIQALDGTRQALDRTSISVNERRAASQIRPDSCTHCGTPAGSEHVQGCPATGGKVADTKQSFLCSRCKLQTDGEPQYVAYGKTMPDVALNEGQPLCGFCAEELMPVEE